MNCPCPAYLHAQAKGDCRCSLRASRAALMLPAVPLDELPVFSENGGHHFHGGIAFPIGQDGELPTPEDAGGWTVAGLRFFAIVAAACIAGAAIAFANY